MEKIYTLKQAAKLCGQPEHMLIEKVETNHLKAFQMPCSLIVLVSHGHLVSFLSRYGFPPMIEPLKPNETKPVKRKNIFTTDEVAKLCKVAPRTVSKWFDSGRLKGYRIEGCQVRRIPRENLIEFLALHGMTPLEEGESPTE